MARRQRIGVFGGTFNPVHNAHLRMALEFRDRLQLDQVHLVVSSVPPHRDAPAVSAGDRLAMLELGIDGEPGLVADDREIRRAGPSWMVDTLADLRSEYGDDASMCLVIGTDAFAGLESWGRWQQLTDHAHIAILQRPGGADMPSSLAQWAQPRWADDPAATMAASAAGSLFRLTLSQLEISATAVRELLRAGRSARYLVPETVLEYIETHRLYA